RFREYFYAVQEHATLVNYATIWAKVLWIACLAYMNRGTLHHRLKLTSDQTVAISEVINSLALVRDSGTVDSDLYLSATSMVAKFSVSVLHQEFDLVNRNLPSGESGVSQYLIP
ncbi:hypothetical protein V1525DRAFT_324631, partial [Lipomyces kononenkoae]